MTETDKNGPAPAFRRTDRTDAPYYLARYAERRGLKQSAQPSGPTEVDEDLPLYLRRFRERGAQTAAATLLEVDGERFTREYAGTSREKEIVAPPERKAQEDFAAEIRIIRHGITQGYSTSAGTACPRASAPARRSGSSAPTPAGPGRPPTRSTAA